MAKKNKGGRPTVFTPELGLLICIRIAEGESVRSICRDPEMPVASTVFLWVIDGKHEKFSEQYDRARAAQADHLFEELLEIADDGSNDWMEKELKDGRIIETVNPEVVARSRLRIDTRKWALAKMLPKRFAERIHQDVTIGAHKSLIDAILAKKKGCNKQTGTE
jgi:hypothetical protein